MSAYITDEEYAQAQGDPEFRQKLLVDKLDLLLAEIAKMRQTKPAPDSLPARQIKEGVDLAVKLADMLQKNQIPDGPQAA
jgi:hypothetical protein